MGFLALPDLEGTTLSGRLMRLPQDLPAHTLVLVMGFTHGARHDVSAWKAALAERGIPFLSLPTAATDLAASDMVEVAGAMRAHVSREAWDQVVQIHRGGEVLRREFGWKVDVFAKVLRVAPGGGVVARHDSGPFTPGAFSAFTG
ncbi:MAG: hypothetical protein Q8K67_02410 [Geothrix sp.]|nr:hypothetical protein [Geothrix sp.]